MQDSGGTSSNSPPKSAGLDNGSASNAGTASSTLSYRPPNEYNPSAEPYTPTTASDFFPSAEIYKSDSYKQATKAESYNPSDTGERTYQQNYQNQQRQNTPSSGYQSNYQLPPTTSANYPQNYQPNYQAPKQQIPPLLKTEPSSTNINPPRNTVYSNANPPSLQRQQSTLNATQRPYQPPSTQPRQPAPISGQKPVQQPQRSSPYTPSSTSYQMNPPQRTAPQTSQSYAPSRAPVQRPPTTTTSNTYSSSPGYTSNSTRSSSSLSFPQETGRWDNDHTTRQNSSRNFSPGYQLEEELKPSYQEPTAESSKEEKTGLQTKLKSLIRQKVLPAEPPLSQITPVRPPSTLMTSANASEVPNKPLARTNSEAKIVPVVAPVIRKDSENFEEIVKVVETPDEKQLKESPPSIDFLKDLDLGEDLALTKDNSPATVPVGLKRRPEGLTPPTEDDTPVMRNIKFFEENDKAKVPLIPKSPSLQQRERPPRPTHIDIVNRNSSESIAYESGVDESPVKHPNLRSIAQPPKKVARISSARSASVRNWTTPRASYPGTPTRAGSAPQRSVPHTPKKIMKTALRFKPGEELVNFFRSPVKKTRFLQHFGNEHVNENHSNEKKNYSTTNGITTSPKKTPSKLPGPPKKVPTSPSKTPLKSPSAAKPLPKTPESPAPPTPLIKKIPMNKIQVGSAPSPNLKTVKSKIGSLANTTHKPGGGNVKIENHKVTFTAQPRIAAKNENYVPSGGEKKIPQVKLQWNAKPKVGSLENTAYRPGGGDRKIESVKLDFKEKAKSKVGSKDNIGHTPGGGAVKTPSSRLERKSSDIENQKLEFKAQSKVGSLDNVKHKPGGGEIKIFDDKTYMKQVSASGSGTQPDCDLSVVTEVRGVSATAEEATDISIKKTTTIAASRPSLSKTTEVTVVTRSPTKERRSVNKSPSTHEVKLTYSTVAPPTKPQPDQKPVQIVKIPAVEHAPVLNPSAGDVDAKEKSPLPSTLSSSNEKKEMLKEQIIENPVKNDNNVKEKPQDQKVVAIPVVKEQSQTPIIKLLQNEAAAHEKVGEIWKEVQNVGFPTLIQQSIQSTASKSDGSQPHAQNNKPQPAVQQSKTQPQQQLRPQNQAQQEFPSQQQPQSQIINQPQQKQQPQQGNQPQQKQPSQQINQPQQKQQPQQLNQSQQKQQPQQIIQPQNQMQHEQQQLSQQRPPQQQQQQYATQNQPPQQAQVLQNNYQPRPSLPQNPPNMGPRPNQQNPSSAGLNRATNPPLQRYPSPISTDSQPRYSTPNEGSRPPSSQSLSKVPYESTPVNKNFPPPQQSQQSDKNGSVSTK